MRIIHIMKDGSTRDSIEGLVIQNREFYQMLNGIIKRKKEEKE